MPPICLTDIKDIANIIKQKYSKELHNMTFVFCYKKEAGKYLIFQEIFSMPIQRFVYHPSNDSISFSAGWSAWGNPHALVADANFEDTEVWKDLLDRSRLYNTTTNNYGGFDDTVWKFGQRQNKTEKKKKKKTKFDTILEFRTDRIERVSFYEWGFEVFSSSLSFIALKSRRFIFPYHMDGDVPNDGEVWDEEEDEDDVGEIRWNGRTFDIENRIESEIYHTAQGVQINPNEPLSYWDKNECDPANDEFDEYLVRTLEEDKSEMDGLLDMGQREIDLLL